MAVVEPKNPIMEVWAKARQGQRIVFQKPMMSEY